MESKNKEQENWTPGRRIEALLQHAPELQIRPVPVPPVPPPIQRVESKLESIQSNTSGIQSKADITLPYRQPNTANPQAESHHCNRCGRTRHPNARFCGYCGNPLTE